MWQSKHEPAGRAQRPSGRGASLLAGALLLAGCGQDLTVPDYNYGSLQDLQSNPTNAAVSATVVGLVHTSRQNMDRLVLLGGHPGREGYYFDPNEPRYVRQLAAGTPDASDFTGSVYWAIPYANVRAAEIVLSVLDNPRLTFSEAEREGIRGFAKTTKAYDLLNQLQFREKIPVTVSEDPTEPAPLADRAAAYTEIARLLDEGKAHLDKAGTTFAFATGSGYSQFGFNTPATYAQVNRALKARMEAYRTSETGRGTAGYQAVLAALSGSFLVVDRAQLNRGAYHAFSSGTGDLANALSDPSGKTVADARLRTDAELQASGARDARYLAKVDSGFNNSLLDLRSDLRFSLYLTKPFYGSGQKASPIPLIRNEELILLRSEARWFTGDRPGATADLNFIRQNSGNLAPIAQPANDDAFITALLKERRYSLMFEGAHRWIDHRRFGRLRQLDPTVAARPGDKVFTFFPYPTAECDARNISPCVGVS